MRHDDHRSLPSRPSRAGFSLIEMMITLVLLAVVVAVIATVMIGSQRSKAVTEGRIEAQQSARMISDMIAADLRSAGYQTDEDTVPNQPPFAYVDSTEIIINANLSPSTPEDAAAPNLPLALNPLGTPLPPALDGTAYEPPVRYLTGAESIRYTLDLNDDGVIDAGDQANALAADAARTRNPDDYVLARVVYGDSSGAVAGNNGGSKERVGIVRGPGAGVPHMFTVYLGANPTAWDWSDGPIPASRLDEISRVEIKVTTEGRRPGPDGTYARQTLTTEINSIRNVPEAATTLYSVEGWIFEDLNKSSTRDTGEPGLPNAIVRMGTVSVCTSNGAGYYRVSGPPAAYVVKQIPPQGYSAFAADSINVDFVSQAADVMHSFADTAKAGGWLLDTCYVDVNLNGVCDTGDERIDGVRVASGTEHDDSDGAGGARLFLPLGTNSVSFTAPESLIVVSANPVTVSISQGASTVIYTRLVRGGTGHVQGTVYRDVDKDGTFDLGEAGLANVWVGVTKNGGLNTLAYAMTDASGNFDIIAPNNMPAAVTPYEVTVIPPGGWYPTSSSMISPIWLATGQVLVGNNFGMSNFTQITLNADRVLSLSSGDLLEKDWTGNASQYATKGSFDKDLVLGSEYVSNPNVSVWWNNWNPPTISTVFDPAPTYSRNAQSSALSVAVGVLDGTVPTQREDVVTGLARKPSGNIAVWLNQNSSGNEGYLVTTPTLYQTQNTGDANVVLLADCGGTTALDLVVGTTGASNQGTVETWLNNGNGAFTRDEIYPPNGNLPSASLGEVKAMRIADVTEDGNPDLILGTKIAPGFSRIHILKFNTRTAGDRWKSVKSYDVTGEITSLTTMPVDADTHRDLVIGLRMGPTSGEIQYWAGGGSGDFTYVQSFVTAGPVLSLVRGDFGGSTRDDLAFGFRTDESAYTGGTRILFLDLYSLPPGSVDPAAGTHSWMAPALTVNNFNYRLNPTTAGAIAPDLAVATKTGPTTGALLVFIR